MTRKRTESLYSLGHPFKAKSQEEESSHFASRREWNHYLTLKTIQDLGEIIFFLRQVPLHIPGGMKYVCDFVVFWANGDVTFEDVKGFKTELCKVKKKLIEHHYPLKIIEV